MTCDEYRAMIGRNPLDCTIAERSATLKHNRECLACAAYLEARYRVALRDIREMLLPEELAQVADECAADVKYMATKDRADPEANQ